MVPSGSRCNVRRGYASKVKISIISSEMVLSLPRQQHTTIEQSWLTTDVKYSASKNSGAQCRKRLRVLFIAPTADRTSLASWAWRWSGHGVIQLMSSGFTRVPVDWWADPGRRRAGRLWNLDQTEALGQRISITRGISNGSQQRCDRRPCPWPKDSVSNKAWGVFCYLSGMWVACPLIQQRNHDITADRRRFRNAPRTTEIQW